VAAARHPKVARKCTRKERRRAVRAGGVGRPENHDRCGHQPQHPEEEPDAPRGSDRCHAHRGGKKTEDQREHPAAAATDSRQFREELGDPSTGPCLRRSISSATPLTNRSAAAGSSSRPLHRLLGGSIALRSLSIGARARSASLIDAESGKTSSTSGSITTTFAPSVYRATVAPRRPSEKSYSARIVSRPAASARFLGCFFIGAPLLRCCPPRRDQARSWRSLCMSHHQQPMTTRHPENQVSLLFCGMIRVELQDGQWIAEDRAGFVERDAVLPRRALLAAFLVSHSKRYPTGPRLVQHPISPQQTEFGTSRPRARAGPPRALATSILSRLIVEADPARAAQSLCASRRVPKRRTPEAARRRPSDHLHRSVGRLPRAHA